MGFADAKQRLAGHRRALEEAGVKQDERLFHEGDYHETGGQEALNALFAKGIPFTAVVCANDDMAAGAMAAAHERGLELPRQLSIVGFDDSPISRYVYPKLTTVHYPITDMADMASRWVLKHVYELEQTEVQQSFEPRLVARDSVAGPA
jgi:LacI family transcriptional regulator